MQTPPDPTRLALLNAILPHVAFEGWSPAAFDAARREIELTEREARSVCPRGAVDLAVLYHRQGDAAMRAALKIAQLSDMRFRDRVAHALRLRIDAITDREAVRRGSALFALPHMAPEGARLMWGTADAIWTELGDTADDVNWYTKRATLAGVYAATVLFWLGDDSIDGQATDAFIDRRIDDVMRIEKVKAAVRDNPVLKPLAGIAEKLASGIRPPLRPPQMDLPGMWHDPR